LESGTIAVARFDVPEVGSVEEKLLKKFKLESVPTCFVILGDLSNVDTTQPDSEISLTWCRPTSSSTQSTLYDRQHELWVNKAPGGSEVPWVEARFPRSSILVPKLEGCAIVRKGGGIFKFKLTVPDLRLLTSVDGLDVGKYSKRGL